MPMLLKKFQCIIISIDYKIVPDMIQKNKIRYVADISMKEKGTGMLRSKSVYAGLIYLSKESWNNKIFEVGDIIEFEEGTKWKSTPFKYILRDIKDVKKYDKSRIEVVNGKPTVPITIYNYQLRAEENKVKIILKNEEFIYCTIPKSRIRLPLTNKNDFFKHQLEWIISPQEYKTLFHLRDKLVEVILYEMQRKRSKRILHLTLNPIEGLQEYQMILSDSDTQDEKELNDDK